MSNQIPLGLQLSPSMTLETFVSGANQWVVDYVESVINGSETQVMIWGGRGVGKTHLLQAYAHHAQYFPIKDLIFYSPDDVLDHLPQGQVLLIDDIDVILRQQHWEIALFNLINAAQAGQYRLVMTSCLSHREIRTSVLDLHSRLAWGGVCELQPLEEDFHSEVVKRHAEARGIELSASLLDYVLKLSPRETSQLSEVLAQLDILSLKLGRKVTKQLIKSVIENLRIPKK